METKKKSPPNNKNRKAKKNIPGVPLMKKTPPNVKKANRPPPRNNQRNRKPAPSNIAVQRSIEAQPGNGVVGVIQVPISFNQLAFSGIPLGLITKGLTMGATDPFAAYQTIYNDIQSISLSGVGVAPARIMFYSKIYGALAPKTVPMGAQGVVNYLIDPGPSSVITNTIVFDQGFTYYLWNPTSGFVNEWSVQAPPGTYSPNQQLELYLALIEKVSSKVPHLTIIRDVSLATDYIRDASAFARNSPYYGQGLSASPAYSIENETPTKSIYLGTLIPFDTTMPRVSRKLDFASGDSISNWNIGLLPDFPPSYYEGAWTPIFKFIDLDELVYSLTIIWQDAVVKYISANAGADPNGIIPNLLEGMGVPWSTFRIMLRQQVLWIFADSQTLGQALCPQVSQGGFQSFVCGSNTFPCNPKVPIMLPGVLNENIRMLMRSNYKYETKNFDSNRNRIIHIPVWGAFKDNVRINSGILFDGEFFPMFTPEPGTNPPDIFDGTYLNGAADFNRTPVLDEAVLTWNEFMDSCSAFIVNAAPIGGTHRNGALLQFTRYVSFATDVNIEVKKKRVNNVMRQYMTRKEVIIKRETSKKNILEEKTYKDIYSPPNSTILVEVTQAVSGYIPITDVHRAVFPQLILPVIELVVGELPTQTQVQTAAKEVWYYTNPALLAPTLNTRAMELLSGVENNVKGTAGEPTELAKFIMAMSEAENGGFLGNLFTTVSSLASIVSPEAGAVLGTIGGIANTLNF